MRRIRLILEYEGTRYVGWQTQPNGTAVQALLEDALFAVTGERIALHGSGRTDSGVHARAQVAHFDTDVRMAADKFAVALNMHLPRDIRVLLSEEAPAGFHARFDVLEKQYRYAVQTGPHARVATRHTALHVHAPLDLPRMRAAAADCLGEHDFSAFMSAGGHVDSAVRTLSVSDWTREGPYLYYDVAGNGFLYNMVRILAGTMLEIGKGGLPPSAIRTALASHERADAGPTAPAHGLTLYRVRYDGFDTEARVNALFGGEAEA